MTEINNSIELNEIRKLDEILRQCEVYVSKSTKETSIADNQAIHNNQGPRIKQQLNNQRRQIDHQQNPNHLQYQYQYQYQQSSATTTSSPAIATGTIVTTTTTTNVQETTKKFRKFVERELFALMCNTQQHKMINTYRSKDIFVSDILINSKFLSSTSQDYDDNDSTVGGVEDEGKEQFGAKMSTLETQRQQQRSVEKKLKRNENSFVFNSQSTNSNLQSSKTANGIRFYHKIPRRSTLEEDAYFLYKRCAQTHFSEQCLQHIKNCLHDNLQQGKKQPPPTPPIRSNIRKTQLQSKPQSEPKSKLKSHLKLQLKDREMCTIDGDEPESGEDLHEQRSCNKCAKQKQSKAVFIQTGDNDYENEITISPQDNLSEKYSRRMTTSYSKYNMLTSSGRAINEISGVGTGNNKSATIQTSSQATPEERRKMWGNNSNSSRYKFSSQIFNSRKLSSKHLSEQDEEQLDKEALLNSKLEIKLPDPVETVKIFTVKFKYTAQ